MKFDDYIIVKKGFDFLLLAILSPILICLTLIIACLLKFFCTGPIIHWSKRVGRQNKTYKMPKFRTMKISTPNLATHKLSNPEKYITNFGKVLRKTSLDELPQIFSILKGDMSFVGPRPALFNQYDLIKLRKKHGVDNLLPGITGWAQINGRDKLSIEQKVMFDKEYMDKKTIFLDIKILWFTILTITQNKNISH